MTIVHNQVMVIAGIFNNMTIPSGTVIDGKYEIRGSIGVGGMGVVYEARQVELDRTVAIKFLAEAVAQDPEAYARFEREGQIISRLHHKNIVAMYGFGNWRGIPYMVMEYFRAQSLLNRLDALGPMQFEQALNVISQLCAALQSAHAHGVVHRDIKPSNVLLNDAGEVKVIDFGLAKILQPDRTEMQKLTEAGTTVGSVEYMSPEQCTGHAADQRSDLYSVGALLHHCLTGSPPFQGEHSVLLMYKHINDAPTRIIEYRPDVEHAAELQAVIDTAMQKDPEARYQNASEMLQDIAAVTAGGTISHKMAVVVPKSANPWTEHRNRKKTAILVASASALIAAAALFGSYLHASQTAPQRPKIDVKQISAELERLRVSHIHGKVECKPSLENAELHMRQAHLYHQLMVASPESINPGTQKKPLDNFDMAFSKAPWYKKRQYVTEAKAFLTNAKLHAYGWALVSDLFQEGRSVADNGGLELGCSILREAGLVPDDLMQLDRPCYVIRAQALHQLMRYQVRLKKRDPVVADALVRNALQYPRNHVEELTQLYLAADVLADCGFKGHAKRVLTYADRAAPDLISASAKDDINTVHSECRRLLHSAHQKCGVPTTF